MQNDQTVFLERVRVDLGVMVMKDSLHFPNFMTGASLSGILVSYPEDLMAEAGVLHSCWDAVGVFYSPSKLGCVYIKFVLKATVDLITTNSLIVSSLISKNTFTPN